MEHNKYVIFFVGGMKPAHRGHYEAIKQYSDHPSVGEVLIIQGKTPREGILGEDMVDRFNTFGGFPENTSYVFSDEGESPISTAHRLVKDKSFLQGYNQDVIYAIGSSDKHGASERTSEFPEYYKKRPGALPANVKVGPPPFIAKTLMNKNGQPISATAIRAQMRSAKNKVSSC